MKRVNVLMSSYNGEKYIEDQIKSIANQVNVLVSIYVRDDGSSDNTRDILSKLSREGIIKKTYFGDNIGYKKSFLFLLENHANMCDYIAFSDQDDIWDRDKLSRGLQLLDKSKNDIKLYFSSMKVVNDNLDKIGQKEFNNLKTFHAAFLRHNAAGCTMVFSPTVANISNLVSRSIGTLEVSHDSLVYIICLWCNGDVLYDEQSRINYRQHANNVTGARQKLKKRLINEVKSLEYLRLNRTVLAEVLLTKLVRYGVPSNIAFLEKYLNYREKKISRYKLFFDKDFKFGRLSVDLYIKILILLGRL